VGPVSAEARFERRRLRPDASLNRLVVSEYVGAPPKIAGIEARSLLSAEAVGTLGAFIATKPRVTEPVQVEGYQGWVGTWTWLGSGLNGGDMMVDGVPTPSGSTEEVLDLTVPTSDDQVKDLTVAATGLTAAELVSMVAAGLTTPAAAAATTTAPNPGATTTGA
jgi:hypothetical protein